MCVRFVSSEPASKLAELFGAAEDAGTLAPSWNIKPGQMARAVRRGADGTRRLEALCWGLMPGYVRSGRQRTRVALMPAERVTLSRTTRAAFTGRRCLVPVTAYYELSERPHAVESTAQPVLAVGAVWECWRHPESGELHEGFAVITRHDADGNLTLPLVVQPEDWALWLGESGGGARKLLTAPCRESWRRWPVSRRLLNTDEDDARLLLPFGVVAPDGAVGGAAVNAGRAGMVPESGMDRRETCRC